MTNEPLGDHVLELEISEITKETLDAYSFTFKLPIDSKISSDRLEYSPGQFLTLRIPSGHTGSVARCYSLSSSPVTDNKLTITVKKTAGGYASHWLCDNAYIGMKMHTLSPSGRFVPSNLDSNFLLLAAGSGITPIISICKSALFKGNGNIVLIYANKNEKSIIFSSVLEELASKYLNRFKIIHWLENIQGLPNLLELVKPYKDYETFICGPEPFMEASIQSLKKIGTKEKLIHIELFESLNSDPFVSLPENINFSNQIKSTAIVTLNGITHKVSWNSSSTLLSVLLKQGINAPFSCRKGRCGACAVFKKSGEVEMSNNEVLTAAELDKGIILGCQAKPISELVELTYDEH